MQAKSPKDDELRFLFKFARCLISCWRVKTVLTFIEAVLLHTAKAKYSTGCEVVRLTLIFNLIFETSELCFAFLKFLPSSGTSGTACSQWCDVGQPAFSGTAQILMCVVFRHSGLCKSSSLGPENNFLLSQIGRDYWDFFFCVVFVTVSCRCLGVSLELGPWVWWLWILLL